MDSKINKLKKGIYSWYGYDRPLEHRLEKIKQAGFESTMLWWGDEVAFWKYSKEQLISLVASKGLELENIHVTYYFSDYLWSDDENSRTHIVNKHLEWIHDCKNFGINQLVMHLTYNDIIAKPNKFGLMSLETIFNSAINNNIDIAVENTFNVSLLEKIITNFQHENIGICYDTSHGNLFEPEKFYILKKFPTKIKCFHISDNDGVDDRHWKIGKGNINWVDFFSLIPHNYTGNLSLEVIQDNPLEEEEHFLRNCLLSLQDSHIDT